MTPDLLLPTRRSFLGWTAALAGCALLTRPALAVPTYDMHRRGWHTVNGFVGEDKIEEPYAVFTTDDGEIFRDAQSTLFGH